MRKCFSTVLFLSLLMFAISVGSAYATDRYTTVTSESDARCDLDEDGIFDPCEGTLRWAVTTSTDDYDNTITPSDTRIVNFDLGTPGNGAEYHSIGIETPIHVKTHTIIDGEDTYPIHIGGHSWLEIGDLEDSSGTGVWDVEITGLTFQAAFNWTGMWFNPSIQIGHVRTSTIGSTVVTLANINIHDNRFYVPTNDSSTSTETSIAVLFPALTNKTVFGVNIYYNLFIPTDDTNVPFWGIRVLDPNASNMDPTNGANVIMHHNYFKGVKALYTDHGRYVLSYNNYFEKWASNALVAGGSGNEGSQIYSHAELWQPDGANNNWQADSYSGDAGIYFDTQLKIYCGAGYTQSDYSCIKTGENHPVLLNYGTVDEPLVAYTPIGGWIALTFNVINFADNPNED